MILIVTGGSRGIGAAVCVSAASRGYDLVINYASDRVAADSVASEVRKLGRRALTVRGDVAVEEDVTALFDAAAELGPLAGVVNNAAITGNTPGRLDEQSAATVKRVLDVNVGGVFLCCKEAVHRMSTRYGGSGGVIVNVSSTAARTGSASNSAARSASIRGGGRATGGRVHYAATKAAVETLTYGLAQEVAREGIRVNAVAPGMVDTGLHEAAGLPDRMERISPTIPLGRPGQPQEIAEAVLWLLSPTSSYATGSVLTVGGGR